MNTYLIDTSVFCKLFVSELDSNKTIKLFEKAEANEIKLVAPNFLYYEVVSFAQYFQLPLEEVIKLLNEQVQTNLNLISPTKTHMARAIDIVKQDESLSIYDAIYQAIAVTENVIFITADKKQLDKMCLAGNAELLCECEIKPKTRS